MTARIEQIISLYCTILASQPLQLEGVHDFRVSMVDAGQVDLIPRLATPLKAYHFHLLGHHPRPLNH
jgi:hypothetical protein